MSENARPKWIALAVVLMICVGLEMKNARNTLWMGRGFYGPLKVRFLGESGVRELLHGHTSHGKQDFKSPESPLSYYSQESGLGVVLGHTEWNRLAAIGMGAGVLASYGKKGQQIDFYELDPLVVKVAKNPELFSYLSDAKQRGVHVKTTLGDGRIELSKAREAYDIIVIDAFQSSAIPVHLVTQEAIDIYLAKLKPNGKLLFHVSGSELNYSALLQSQFAVFGLQFYKYIDQGRGLHKDASIWVMGKYTDHNFEKGLTSLTHRGLGPTWTDASHNIWDLF